MTGQLIGVGVGPGDPELITLKAQRALAAADVVAFFAKAGNTSTARRIAAVHLRPGIEELPLYYPMTTEVLRHDPVYRAALHDFYQRSAAALAALLDAGRTVAVLAEGDPLFYGSYMHLHARLAPRYPTQVIPGVTGMSGCWSAVATPIAQGDDVLAVLPGTLPEEELERRIGEADAVVVMKLGRNLPKVRRAIERAGRLERAIYVERGTMAEARTQPLVQKLDDVAPYFSIVLVPGWEKLP